MFDDGSWCYGGETLGCSFCALGQADQAGQTDQADLVLAGRPVEPGLYFFSIPLAQPVSDQARIMQLARELNSVRIPQAPGVFVGSFLSPETNQALSKELIVQALESPNPSALMKAVEQPELLFDVTTATLTALGLWVWVSERQEDNGLVQPITTYFSKDGRVVYEVGADGRQWTPQLAGVFWGVVAIIVALAFILAILDRWLGLSNQSANGTLIAPKTNKNQGFFAGLIAPIQEGLTSLFMWGAGLFFGGLLLFGVGKRALGRAIR